MSEVVLITGTRKGIGRYLAEYYIERGMTVVGCSRRETDLSHPSYWHRCLDVADEKAVQHLTAAIAKEHGRLDVLINNAGIASMNHFLLTPQSAVEKIVRTNFTGTFTCCREAARIMARRGWGRIVNFTTIAVPMNLEGEAAYAATKAAVESLTRILARELASLGITCNAVGPAPIKTDLIENVPAQKIEALLARQAIREYALENDVANVVDFFISKASRLVTGQIVYLGGPT